MAAKSTRKRLIEKHHSAILAIERLNALVFEMVQLAEGRSEPVTMMAPTLADGHEVMRSLWDALRDQL